jgi:hypothetical protein
MFFLPILKESSLIPCSFENPANLTGFIFGYKKNRSYRKPGYLPEDHPKIPEISRISNLLKFKKFLIIPYPKPDLPTVM